MIALYHFIAGAWKSVLHGDLNPPSGLFPDTDVFPATNLFP